MEPTTSYFIQRTVIEVVNKYYIQRLYAQELKYILHVLLIGDMRIMENIFMLNPFREWSLVSSII